MKTQIKPRNITTFRNLLERLVREKAEERIARRRVRSKKLPAPAEPVEARK